MYTATNLCVQYIAIMIARRSGQAVCSHNGEEKRGWGNRLRTGARVELELMSTEGVFGAHEFLVGI